MGLLTMDAPEHIELSQFEVHEMMEIVIFHKFIVFRILSRHRVNNVRVPLSGG